MSSKLYATIEGSINPSTTTSLSWDDHIRGYSYFISNDASAGDFTVKLNDTGYDAQTIKAGEVYEDNDFEITSPITMYNASTSTIPYRIRINGA